MSDSHNPFVMGIRVVRLHAAGDYAGARALARRYACSRHAAGDVRDDVVRMLEVLRANLGDVVHGDYQVLVAVVLAEMVETVN